MEDRIFRRKISDEVLDRLLTLVERGEIAPGDALPSERELMQRFGVGRPAIREALQAMAALGLIRIQQGERSRLLEPSAKPVFEQIDRSVRHLLKVSPDTREHFRDARLTFETGVVRAAAERARPDDIERLRNVLAEQKRAAGNAARFMALDVAFHRAIAAATGNPVLEATSEALFTWILEYFPRLWRVPGTEPLTLREHGAILEAIARHDADAAHAALTSHLKRLHPSYQEPVPV